MFRGQILCRRGRPWPLLDHIVLSPVADDEVEKERGDQADCCDTTHYTSDNGADGSGAVTVARVGAARRCGILAISGCGCGGGG